ncbi:YgiT-type zinc finger protein [Streptomyces sp. A2-16]|nr:YgiT-type zinc finger protein [Streptomyces sp. A2-16]
MCWTPTRVARCPTRRAEPLPASAETCRRGGRNFTVPATPAAFCDHCGSQPYRIRLRARCGLAAGPQAFHVSYASSRHGLAPRRGTVRRLVAARF